MERLELGWLGIEGQSTTGKNRIFGIKLNDMSLNNCIREQILHNYKYLGLDSIVVIHFFQSYDKFLNYIKIDANFGTNILILVFKMNVCQNYLQF